MALPQVGSFRDILRNEFQKRIRKNKRYRLVDFAKDFKTPTSRMSEILSGKSGISKQRAEYYAKILKMNKSKAKVFLDLVNSECSRLKWARSTPKSVLRKNQGALLNLIITIPYFEKENFVQDLKKIINEHIARYEPSVRNVHLSIDIGEQTEFS